MPSPELNPRTLKEFYAFAKFLKEVRNSWINGCHCYLCRRYDDVQRGLMSQDEHRQLALVWFECEGRHEVRYPFPFPERDQPELGDE